MAYTFHSCAGKERREAIDCLAASVRLNATTTAYCWSL